GSALSSASTSSWRRRRPLYSTTRSPLAIGCRAKTPLPWMRDLRATILRGMRDTCVDSGHCRSSGVKPPAHRAPGSRRRGGGTVLFRARRKSYNFGPDWKAPILPGPYMLRVTRLTDYATVVLTVLAQRPGKVLSAPELAEAAGLETTTVS